MDTQEWVAQCSARLHTHWPGLNQDMRDLIAVDLRSDERWQHLEPEVAVVQWLRQVVPASNRNAAA